MADQRTPEDETPSADGSPPPDVDVLTLPEHDPDRLPPLIRPAVDFIARIRATVHTKLLAAFLVIAVLLLGMGVMSILVIGRMNAQADELLRLQQLNTHAREAIYGVTAQSHFRAMALITRIDSWNDKIAVAKSAFTEDLDAIEAIGGPGVQASIDRMREIDGRFAEAGTEVLRLFERGDIDSALALHISAEHEISHELEDELNVLIDSFASRVDAASVELASLHRFLLIAVGVFSGISLAIALGLGAVLSWSLIRPMRTVDRALGRIAGGDFEEEVEVQNRDEFGRLAVNLNRTRGQLAKMYRELEDLNENLETQVKDQLGQIRRAEQLRRYLAPQVADAVRRGTDGGHVHAPQPHDARRRHPRAVVDVGPDRAGGADRRREPALLTDDRRGVPARRHDGQIRRRRRALVLRRWCGRTAGKATSSP